MKISGSAWAIIVLVLGFGFLLVLVSQKNSNSSFPNATIPVKVEVFSDYNCSHCALFENYVKDVKTTFGDKVDLESKQLPILTESRSPDTSLQYAYAAEAARLQGKFDQYHEDLFKWVTYHNDSSNTIFSYSDSEKTLFAGAIDPVALAQFLGLDITQFQADMQSDTIKNLVASEKSDAISRMGSPSTPAVFIAGTYYKMTTYDELKSKIQEIITRLELKSN